MMSLFFVDLLIFIRDFSHDKISVIPEATTQEDPFHKSVRFDVLVREEFEHEILLNDLCYKNFYIFNQYANIKDEATREYMEYFSTQKHESEKMKRIHELVGKYRLDPIAKKAYMTLEQELNIREKKARADEKRKIAKAFRDRGVAIDVIVESTGLTPEEIKVL